VEKSIIASERDMRFGHALRFVFQDDDWFKKILLPAACLFIPLLGVFLTAGWALEICRREIRKQAPALPSLSFSRNLRDGLAVWGIFLASSLPLLLWLGMGGIFNAALVAAKKDSGAVDLFWWGFEFAGLAVAAAGGVWTVAAIGRLADTGSFREVLRIRGVVRAISTAPAVYVRAVFSWLGLGLLAVSGIAVCGVGLGFTSAFAAAAAFHLAGQAFALAAAGRASPDSPPPA
jgi:hypothetical protein